MILLQFTKCKSVVQKLTQTFRAVNRVSKNATRVYGPCSRLTFLTLVNTGHEHG